jgi:hypothetical protein
MLHKETHKGFEIVIEDVGADDDQAMAAMAMAASQPMQNVKIDVTVGDSGKFSTSYLPYTTYNSVLDLAKAVIDHTPDFDTLSNQ